MACIKMKILSQISIKKIDLCSFCKMEHNTKVSGTLKQINVMDEDIRFGPMVASMKGTGKRIRPMAEVDSSMLMAISMTGTGKMIKLTASDNILILMALNTKVIGLMTSNMDMEKSIGLMVHNMKETTSTAKRTVMEPSSGLTSHHIAENSSIIIFMETVLINGQTTESTLVIGLTTKCMVLVYLHGLMVENMTVNILMIKSKVTECSLGPIIDNTMATG